MKEFKVVKNLTIGNLSCRMLHCKNLKDLNYTILFVIFYKILRVIHWIIIELDWNLIEKWKKCVHNQEKNIFILNYTNVILIQWEHYLN